MKGLRNLFSSTPRFNRRMVEKGKVSPNKPVPSHIIRPEYAETGIVPSSPKNIKYFDKDDIPRLRKAGRLARKVLEFALSQAKPGVTTDDIDALAFDEIVRHGAYPSPINYSRFPKAICTSVNEVICHGIPDDRPLEAGDILSIDVSVFVDGVHGDNCGTVIVGDPSELTSEDDEVARKLVEANRDVLDMAIAGCEAGSCLSMIGHTIENEANNRGFEVVSRFCGHGVGPLMHMEPFVVHYRNNSRLPLRPGMVFTIEPILVEGSEDIQTWPDGWSAVTVDGGRGAQFEHEILITESGPPEILTSLE